MKRFILFLLCTVMATASWAQLNPVKYTWKATHLGGNEYELVFDASIEDGWYTYSQYLESMDGPVPTSINFESKNEEKVGKATETSSSDKNKVSGFDEMFDMNITKYKHDLKIRQKFKVTDPNKTVSGYLEYMTCDDTRCLPPTAVEFEFTPKSLMVESTTGEADPGTSTEPAPADANVPAEVATEVATEEPNTPTETAETPSETKPVVWKVDFVPVSENEVDLVAKAQIAEGWYVYSQNLASDDGPVKTSINFEEGVEVKEISNEESASRPDYVVNGIDEVFEMEVTKYKHDFTIKQRLNVSDPSKPITGFLEYMTCDATKCMPPTAVEFNFTLKPGATPTPQAVAQKGIYDPVIPSLTSTNAKPLGNCGGETGDTLADVNDLSLWTIFLWGFAGGLVALLTPCVFPMIPMTVSLFSKGKQKSKAQSINNALIFGASIIVIYVSLGLMVTAAFGADALNQLSTHWVMNLIFFVLFTVFAFSFFGYFEITLPSSWANRADAASMKGGLIGTFFGAFSICLVSFSCTGPIIGTLLVKAIEVGFVAPTVGMLGFSVALALPFTLFAAFPGWLQSLPNSGSWMTTMKVILGFVELALGLKFLSTADLTEHWGILPYELFMGLWVLIFGATTAYLLGFIRFPHDNPNAKISNPRKGLAAVAGLFTLYLASGFMTNPKGNFVTPSLISGLPPAVCYSYINPCDCPAMLDQCFHDYYEALEYAKQVNKPLLIDFTGYGCVNCRKMEDNVWPIKEVNDVIRDEYVLVSLYVDDREPLADKMKTPAGVTIRNVGNKWAAFQEANFKTQSQPYYVLINTKEEVLNTPVGYTPDEETYLNFLKCGVEQFKASMGE